MFKAKVKTSEGIKHYLNGVFHRDEGPAIEWCSTGGFAKQWYKNGILHREDGPAIEGVCEDWYFFEGEQLPHSNWLEKVRNVQGKDKKSNLR